MKKDLVTSPFSLYSLAMSLIPFPADSADYEEYVSVMEAMADEVEASVPDCEPVHSDARYTDAEVYPESQYGGDGPWNADEESDELRQRESDDYWQSMSEHADEPREEPDAHDDSDPYGCDDHYSEYGMDGCCGDF